MVTRLAAPNDSGPYACRRTALNWAFMVELLASYSNTAPQVSELYGRVLGSMRESDDDVAA